MFAAFLRAGPNILLAALLGAILKVATGPFFDLMGPRSVGHPLRMGLEAVTANWLVVAILAVAVGLIHSAVVESRVSA
ncbi:hypothetical protein [Halomarina oriensis]|uniref:Uncharacterized protein n=1 Tax=Halomarina oriensis TaxID=671145 RepID=A0A6B0GR93_9EURY|nr:hypothetical protein [Halomarina oriensis]MWG35897.1 hypothetical protein [Halomarina oriensis]